MGLVLTELAEIVGAEHVLTDADVRATYETDWTRRFVGRCAAVVRPVSAEQVAEVVLTCRKLGLPVVSQGGNTGLVGGGIPYDDAIVISTTRMRRVLEIDSVSGQVSVEAGLRLSTLDDALADSGWEFGVDLGARESATLGGMAATNAGGTRVLRYGSMRANVIGLQAVLPDGTIITRMSGLVKDNTGYDLTGLMVGSEGTLGVITQLRLRLVPRWPNRAVCVVPCTTWSEAVALSSRVRRHVEGLDSLEAFDDASMRAVAVAHGIEPLRGGNVFLLIGWAGREGFWNDLQTAIGDRPNVSADDDAGRARLWRYRETIAESIARVGIPHKYDITIPIADVAAFSEVVERIVRPHQLYLFGHLGDGNLHVNVVGPAPADDELDERVLRLVADFGGSISAEHGVGRMKAPYLHLSRSPEEILAMQAIKQTFDRYGLFNPGVILTPFPRRGAASASQR